MALAVVFLPVYPHLLPTSYPCQFVYSFFEKLIFLHKPSLKTPIHLEMHLSSLYSLASVEANSPLSDAHISNPSFCFGAVNTRLRHLLPLGSELTSPGAPASESRSLCVRPRTAASVLTVALSEHAGGAGTGPPCVVFSCYGSRAPAASRFPCVPQVTADRTLPGCPITSAAQPRAAWKPLPGPGRAGKPVRLLLGACFAFLSILFSPASSQAFLWTVGRDIRGC